MSDVATLPWEIQKSHFSTFLFIYFRLFTLAEKKTNSNCCTAVLAVYLLLFSVSYSMHSPIAAYGARYRRNACIEYQSAIRSSCGSCLLRHGLNFSRTWCMMQLISGEKRLEACVHGEGGHFEHLL